MCVYVPDSQTDGRTHKQTDRQTLCCVCAGRCFRIIYCCYCFFSSSSRRSIVPRRRSGRKESFCPRFCFVCFVTPNLHPQKFRLIKMCHCWPLPPLFFHHSLPRSSNQPIIRVRASVRLEGRKEGKMENCSTNQISARDVRARVRKLGLLATL